MNTSDKVKLRHMLDAAQEALSFAADKTRADLNANRQLALALVKEIEIIGEAASKVSDEGRQNSTAIPWRDIIDMRNYLIHAYFNVDLDQVWSTIQNDLPPLIEALKNLEISDADN